MNRVWLVLALLLLSGCSQPLKPDASFRDQPVPDLSGRWWEYPMFDSVTLTPAGASRFTGRGAVEVRAARGEAQRVECALEFVLEGRLVSGIGRPIGPDSDGALGFAGLYTEHPSTQDYLDSMGLFDMGSAFADAREPLRALSLRIGRVEPDEFTGLDWEQRWNVLGGQVKRTYSHYIVSPVSFRDPAGDPASLWHVRGPAPSPSPE